MRTSNTVTQPALVKQIALKDYTEAIETALIQQALEYYAGKSISEVAKILGTSHATLYRKKDNLSSEAKNPSVCYQPDQTLKEQVAAYESELIDKTLKQVDGDLDEAARLLSTSKATIYRKTSFSRATALENFHISTHNISNLHEYLAAVSLIITVDAYLKNDQSKSKTAIALGISKSTLEKKIAEARKFAKKAEREKQGERAIKWQVGKSLQEQQSQLKKQFIIAALSKAGGDVIIASVNMGLKSTHVIYDTLSIREAKEHIKSKNQNELTTLKLHVLKTESLIIAPFWELTSGDHKSRIVDTAKLLGLFPATLASKVDLIEKNRSRLEKLEIDFKYDPALSYRDNVRKQKKKFVAKTVKDAKGDKIKAALKLGISIPQIHYILSSKS